MAISDLPDMVIEKRESTTAHGITPPDTSKEYLAHDLQELIKLNQDANLDGWSERTLDILSHHIPARLSVVDIPEAVLNVTGFKSWREVTVFVQEDMCLEFFNMALYYCLKEGQRHKVDRGFIDGSGIGYAMFYIQRLKRTLEQCFDAKYFYKIRRPLQYIWDEYGMDLTEVANYIHPGHWSYPAGHGTKFLTAVEVLNDLFHLDDKCYNNLLTAACVCAHGRSGNMIHYLQDNLGGGQLTKLKEFK